MKSRRAGSRTLLFAFARFLGVVVLLSASGCRNRNQAATLTPPLDAPGWETRFGEIFDDSLTRKQLNLSGRAPNDVRDQSLFNQRLGHANIVVLARIEQIGGRGRHRGRRSQYVELQLGEFLLGELPPDASAERHRFAVYSEDPIPAELVGSIVLVFLRWAPGKVPAYHHHLLLADRNITDRIKIAVQHAEREGQISTRRKRRKRAQ